MMNKVLMGASFLALLAAFPAFAADTSANANVSAETKIENTLDKAGKSIERTTEKAKDATKDAYADVKAYFSDDDDIKAMTSVNVVSRLTADEVIGATVQNPKGENIGKVEDILVDKDGDAERLIINDGGVLGLGGKVVSFDYDVIEGLNGDADVVVKLTDANIKKAAAFDLDVIPADLYRVSKITGSKVVDTEGKNVATVDTVAFDGDDADYLIVTFNKILGMGGDKAALNFEALDMTNVDGKYTFKLNTQQSAQFENYKQSTKAN